MSRSRHLLASDLDGTLIPPESVVGDGGLAELRAALSAGTCELAYVTGRHLALALEGIERHGLPSPATLVCDVGTSIFIRRGGGYEADPEYRRRMVEASGGVELGALRERLADAPGLRLQEPEKQADFKLSYYAPDADGGRTAALLVASILGEAGASANVVQSVDPVSGLGLVDVLPAGVAKDTAVRYLHDRSGMAEEHLVYAGDSGNDRAAMLSGFNVVVVGNAAAAFKRSIRLEADETGLADRVYVAEASYALGVLEGCRHFGIL